MPSVITLTTDFGENDWFVGVMKGVILARCPHARIVDITHLVPPGDIRSGAFVLLTAYRFFPENTIHVAIVDPGVGSERRAIAVRTAHATFVGPDNGLLSWAITGAKHVEVRQIQNQDLLLKPVSATFHGRDMFAPAAAYLACGGSFAKLGSRVEDWVRLQWPEPLATKQGWTGEILYVDRYGNAITNLPNTIVSPERYNRYRLVCRRRQIQLAPCYSSVPIHALVVVPGSTGYLEIAVNRGNASKLLRLSAGHKVKLTVQPSIEVSEKDPFGASANRLDRRRTGPNRRP